MSRLLSLSRYIVIIPVLASLLGATMLMLYGAVQTVVEGYEVISYITSGDNKAIKQAAIALIEIVDVFLIATVLYIIAVGLYELFIGELVLPSWLVIANLDDLKVKLIGVVVTVLAVFFLGQVLVWDGTAALLPYGAAIALVIVALTWFLSQQSGTKSKTSESSTKKEYNDKTIVE